MPLIMRPYTFLTLFMSQSLFSLDLPEMIYLMITAGPKLLKRYEINHFKTMEVQENFEDIICAAYLAKERFYIENITFFQQLGSGIVPVEKDDMALIFYVTLENTCEKSIEISVEMVQCCETTSKVKEPDCNSMFLIGGNMGFISPSSVKNVTLIYPNLYLNGREGVCTVMVEGKPGDQKLSVEIKFCTNGTREEEEQPCPTSDQDCSNNCAPVDCVMKYNGFKSFFNPACGECEEVPECCSDPTKCLPEWAYSVFTNNCTNLNETMTAADLQLLESENTDISDDVCPAPNIICHQGVLDSEGQCQCYKNWVSSINDNEENTPSLMHTHMCNIEVGGWNYVNKGRIKTTAVIIAILALTIVSKIIVLMCVLNWCYKHFRKPSPDKTCADRLHSFDESLILCDNLDFPVDKCICRDLSGQRLPVLTNETVNVCYYPCMPSTTSTEGKGDKSIALSKTTSGSGPVSYETETECECSSDKSETSDEDYEIQFSEDEEEVNEENSSEHLVDYDGQGEEESEHSAPNEEESSESRPDSRKTGSNSGKA